MTYRLLSQLVGQLAHPDDEVVVVDGGSRDATATRVKEWSVREPRIRLIIEPGAGISAGRNAGVRACRNTFVACIDAGCDPAAGWLAAFRAAAADWGTDQLFTGVYRAVSRGPMQAALAAVGYPDPAELRHPSLLSRGYGRFLGRSFDAAMPTGRSVAFEVAVWRLAGGFPEELRTAEDVLFGRRVVAAGAPATLVADAEVSWEQRGSLRATARMYYRYGQGSGRSRDLRLLRRDSLRLAAYLAVPLMAWLGGWLGWLAVAVGAAAYLSLPVVRVLRAGRSARPRRYATALTAATLLPVVAAVRDLAKVAGAVQGLLPRRRP